MFVLQTEREISNNEIDSLINGIHRAIGAVSAVRRSNPTEIGKEKEHLIKHEFTQTI